jgi:hypothetical protein
MNVPYRAQPTSDLVNDYIKQFDESDAGSTDQALTRLIAAFPNNHDEVAVLIKASAINILYSTSIYAIARVAKHIHQLDIDARLRQGDPELVDAIARITINGKLRRNYSFASKYCSWHTPEQYPIYDSYVDHLLWDYQRQDHFTQFKRGELADYPRYKEILNQFRSFYGLEQFSFKELDKFLWKYRKKISESSATTTSPAE